MLITYNVHYDVSFEVNSVLIDHNKSVLNLGHYIDQESNKRNLTQGINSLIIQTNTMIS